MARVNIAGIDKAELLAALYNNSKPMGMGFLQARAGVMTREIAQEIIDKVGDDHKRMFPTIHAGTSNLKFDYLYGRPLKCNLEGDEVDTWGYNRDHGEDAFEKVVEGLRNK
jgi:hypothetical protein